MGIVKRLLTIFENISVFVVYTMILLFLVQLLCFTSFRIPSDSMEPTLKDGDWILVNKMIKGARLFDVFSALDGEQVAIYRFPGYGDFKRNDVLVFNFPYDKSRWDSIRMDVMQYYVKRCIALPGDTLEIRKGFYKVRGCSDSLGNSESQQYLAELESPQEQGIVIHSFPYNEEVDWNIREFGPLLIPSEGKNIIMNRTNYFLYKELISWEQKAKLHIKDEQVLLGDSVIYRYHFEKNYYFVSGDQMANSQDSRYWGMLPEEYIVGKVTCIWYSENKYTNEICWKRILKYVE